MGIARACAAGRACPQIKRQRLLASKPEVGEWTGRSWPRGGWYLRGVGRCARARDGRPHANQHRQSRATDSVHAVAERASSLLLCVRLAAPHTKALLRALRCFVCSFGMEEIPDAPLLRPFVPLGLFIQDVGRCAAPRGLVRSVLLYPPPHCCASAAASRGPPSGAAGRPPLLCASSRPAGCPSADMRCRRPSHRASRAGRQPRRRWAGTCRACGSARGTCPPPSPACCATTSASRPRQALMLCALVGTP